jgi:hypothetical protein
MAVGLGGAEMLIMLVLGGGLQSGDLVSYLPAEAYFRSRDVPVNLDNMIYFAEKEPADGVAQIKQLMCLRLLAEQPEVFKKGKDKAGALVTLRKIASGELANDRMGFAKEYAQRALAVLDGAKEPARPAAPALEDGLGWFPKDVTLAGVVDPRRRDAGVDSGKEMRSLIAKMVRPRELDEFFRVAETLGNIRIERLSFAYVETGKEPDRVYLRLTGKADHKRVAQAIKALTPGEALEINETKDAKGTTITTIHSGRGGHSPIVALIGDTDLVVAGPTGGRRGGDVVDPKPYLEPLLAVRAGKADGVLKGDLKERLTAGVKAYGVLAGAVPKEMRFGLFRGGPPVPRSLRVEMLQAKDGVELRMQAAMADAEEATQFTNFISMGRKQALEQLQQAPQDRRVPPGVITGFKKALESVQVKAQGANVEGSVYVPGAAAQGAISYFLLSSGPELDLEVPPAKKLFK